MTSDAPERPSDEDFETWCREDRSLAIREARRARESEADLAEEFRLERAMCDQYRGWHAQHTAALAAKDAEIAALKAEVESAWDQGWIVGSHDTPGYRENKELRDRAEKAEAEVERLRAALERIAHQDIDCGLGKGICDTCNGPTIAREALENKNG